MAAKAKVTQSPKLVDLAKRIKAKHSLIQRESDEMETLKAELQDKARVTFFTDLCATVEGKDVTKVIEGTPDVYGNHEIPVDNNDKVTVNFQSGNKSFTKIEDKPAANVLKGIFGDDYSKIFTEGKRHEVISDEVTQDDEHSKKPELFGYSVRHDADGEALRTLYAAHPELFQRQVVDLEGYAKAFPNSVETTTVVSTGKGFIEKVGKVDNHVRNNAKNFIAGLFAATLKVVVKCGNAKKR
jgi:hypothetical protein